MVYFKKNEIERFFGGYFIKILGKYLVVADFFHIFEVEKLSVTKLKLKPKTKTINQLDEAERFFTVNNHK